MKRMFKKVVIVGLGFMGASLGLAVKKAGLAGEVCGLGRNLARLKKAKAMGAADCVTTDAAQALSGADFVVISLPVMMIPATFNSLKQHLGKNAIVTDMGSVKGAICSKISLFDTGRQFTGSHPMVGGEKTGAGNAREGLYKGGVCIVTVNSKVKSQKSKLVRQFWKALGMKVIAMTPEKHDAVMAGISHLPHMAAFALVNANEGVIKSDKEAIGPGFKSTTRIAASGEEIWAEIFLMNKREVMEQADRFIGRLQELRSLVERSDIEAIKRFIERSRKLRESLDK